MIHKIRATIGAALIATAVSACTPVINTPDQPAPIEEDDTRWDCHTMGNRVCGPTGGDAALSGCTTDTNGYCVKSAL